MCDGVCSPPTTHLAAQVCLITGDGGRGRLVWYELRYVRVVRGFDAYNSDYFGKNKLSYSNHSHTHQ